MKPSDDRPLAEASTRLRRKPGRPKGATLGLAPRSLTVEAAQAYTGLSRSALWRFFKSGKLRKIVLDGVRSPLVLRADLDALLDDGVVPASKDPD